MDYCAYRRTRHLFQAKGANGDGEFDGLSFKVFVVEILSAWQGQDSAPIYSQYRVSQYTKSEHVSPIALNRRQ